jgi:hypothetical protein
MVFKGFYELVFEDGSRLVQGKLRTQKEVRRYLTDLVKSSHINGSDK